jgi:guanosine-3',5'-bis(diphosphate) 3'-pyrophosphohydrolase
MLDADLFKRALDFAARAHGTQTVPGSGFPYVVHVTKVATEALLGCLSAQGLEANFAVPVALLHDTMEDAGVSHTELVSAFGAQVADGVRALTKDEQVPKERRMTDCLARIRQQPKEVWAVKLADRITNLEPPPPQWPQDKRRRYHAEAKEILATLSGACPALEQRFRVKLDEYQQHLGVE